MIGKTTSFGFLTGVLLVAGTALAQETQTIPFEGGTLTITETDESDRILSFDGKELARNFVVFHDRTVEVGGEQVALFAAGDGGNACGAATVIVWKPASGIRSEIVGEDCGAPPASVNDTSIVFVPYLLPGESRPVQSWAPDTGLRIAGILAYIPEPGTGWAEADPESVVNGNVIDMFRNEAIYNAARDLLGDKMTDVTTGLLVGGGVETLPSGAFYGSGCVPHACGVADAFMGVDARAQKLYFAQEGEQPAPDAWPVISQWPADLRDAMTTALGDKAQ